MAGFLRRLFGGGEAGAPRGKPGKAVEYEGFTIVPEPMRSGGGFVTAGLIRKDFPDGAKEHRFIRADTHASFEDAETFAVTKARQIIDELGDRLFG
jgi:hypothetical protein